jgi:V8-like Glu-specific endopeptidase
MFRPCFDGLESRKVFSLAPVPPSAPSPFSAIVKLEGIFPDGESYVGSGFLVDSYHVLTAGHLVYDYDDGGFAASITVIPELYGTSQPFGAATMIKERTMPAWQAFSAAHPDLTGPDAQDIGLITLNRQIGNETGWMSYGYSNDTSTYAAGAIFDTAGYPADPASGYDGLHMAYSSGPIVGLPFGEGAIAYHQSDISTYGGQSGSPLWAHSTGVVSGVVCGAEIPNTAGRFRPAISGGGAMGMATRITPAIDNYLRRLIVADTPPVPPPPALQPPGATSIGPVWRSRRGITSIGVNFDQPLNPSSARRRRQYDVVADVVRHVKGHDVMDQKALRIQRVGYVRNTQMVRIYLARPSKGTVKVIVYPGLVSANGAVSTQSYSWVVR